MSAGRGGHTVHERFAEIRGRTTAVAMSPSLRLAQDAIAERDALAAQVAELREALERLVVNVQALKGAGGNSRLLEALKQGYAVLARTAGKVTP